MRQLFPACVDDVDPADYYDDAARLAPRERPYVYVNMVASVDGGTVVGGVTEKLASPGDRHIFFLLRSMADGILVGAETVRAEGYGPPRVREAFAPGRQARGQQTLPRIAVVTRSLDLDWASPLFTEGTSRPFVLAPGDSPADRLERADAVADVVTTPGPRLDLRAALQELAARGIRALLCEGGPTLNSALLGDGLVDELCLTVAPCLVGSGGGAKIVGGAPLAGMTGLTLAHVLEEDDNLFLRYLVPAASA